MANPEAAPTTVAETRTAQAPVWHVIVLNDPVNLMQYVTMVFRRVFGFSLEKAQQHMLEVHHKGRSRLWSGEREKAENFVYQLQQWQLTAVLESSDG